MLTTLLFYDLETSGLNPCFDQTLQFAAKRVDSDWRSIETVEYNIQINSDVFPHPEAMKVHGIDTVLLKEGLNEYVALQNIHQLMNSPNTINLGYNTLGFDEIFLRFSFYRNLLSPYSHQFSDGCGRMDIYPMLVFYYLFYPHILEWPTQEERVSLKLEDINAANKLSTGPAHLALSDVETTLALAKVLYSEETAWQYLTGYFHKGIDSSRTKKISEGLAISGKIGSKNNFISSVLYLGEHKVYTNQTLWLRLDVLDLSEIAINPTRSEAPILRKKYGEPPFILPNFPRFKKKISTYAQDLTEKNKQYLQEHPVLLEYMQTFHLQDVYPPIEKVDPDATLYLQPFPNLSEKRLFAQFHQATVEEKIDIAEKISNPIRKTHALRILGRHYYDALPPHLQKYFDNYIKNLSTQIPRDYLGREKYLGELSVT